MKNENSKIDLFYKCLVDELQLMKGSLMNEMKYSSAQVQALYQGLTKDKTSSSAALEQEIRYSYKQNQNIYEGLAVMVKNDIAQKINAIEDKMTALEQLSAIINDLGELKYNYQQMQAVYESLSSLVSGEIAPKLAEMATKEETQSLVEESVSVHSQNVLDAVAALPTPESVDYARISGEVGDKLLEILAELKAADVEGEEELVDYERVACDTAAKVIESLPYPEPVDYNQIEERMEDVLAAAISVEAIAKAVAETVNVDAVAEAVASKLVMPAAPEVDYEKLAEMVAAKIVAPAAPEVDYDKLADIVVEKIAAKGISADVVLDEEGIVRIADTVAEKVGTLEVASCAAAMEAPVVQAEVDYDRVAVIVEEKLIATYENMEKVVALDDEGIDKIVGGIADELRNMTLVCEYEEEAAPVEEAVEAVVEETVVQEEIPVEEIVEEVAEEVVEEAPVEEIVEEAPVEEVVEEAPVEEVVEEAPVEEAPVEEVKEELAAAEAVASNFEEDMDGQLIDAETGLVVRLKRSFTAKMKQSEEQVKVYYSDLKNALTSYKRINSNVSWHGDRFNYGRETVAKIGINGKTLCFYLALDPNDTELKSTVYHQKDVGAQKAYESTPFMVKVRSDAAAKKALRLVGVLAEKLGAEQDEAFEEVDYVAEFAYASTKRLYEEGDIKATKEKKVDFNF